MCFIRQLIHIKVHLYISSVQLSFMLEIVVNLLPCLTTRAKPSRVVHLSLFGQDFLFFRMPPFDVLGKF